MYIRKITIWGQPRATQSGFKLLILLPQPPECWYYTHSPVHPEMVVFFKVGCYNAGLERLNKFLKATP
jgi:hypothetical protein